MSACVFEHAYLKRLFIIKQFEKIFFVNRKWSNDLRVDCKPLSNLVEMIKKDFDFEEEL
jgi:hypothetical protein